MRSLARRLFTLCSAASLLLCVAVCVLWVRSYWRFSDVGRVAHRRDAGAYTQSLIRLGSTHGTLLFTWRDVVWPWSNPHAASVAVNWERASGWFWTSKAERPNLSAARRPGDRGWQFSAFGWGVYKLDWQSSAREPALLGYVVKVPHALPSAALAILPTLALLRWRRGRRRHREGLCPRCGYDLRASPERCPECGTVPVPKETT